MQENLAPRRIYGRDSVEFARTLTFTDGLFAIAMTLLVVDLAVPTLSDGSSVHQLAEALNDDSAKFISFFISFAVIGPGRVHVVPHDPLRVDRRSLEARGGRRAADGLKPWASEPRDYRHG